MKNSEKFVTAQERAEAFHKWCKSHYNADVCFSAVRDHNCSRCGFAWLDLEAADEKPKPCIWCNHETYVCEGQNYVQVRCNNCMAEGPKADSKEHAILNYNRVAKAVRESEWKR